MTRFARSKGSKASNERVCEEATSWQEMKSQLLQQKNEIQEEEKRKEAEEQRNLNYQNFLKERDEQAASGTKWAEFPDVSGNNKKGQDNISEKSKVIIKKKKKVMNKVKLTHNVSSVIDNSVDNEMDSGVETQYNLTDEINVSKKKEKRMKKVSKGTSSGTEANEESDEEDVPLEVSSKIEAIEPKPKKSKNKKKQLKIILNNETETESSKAVGTDKVMTTPAKKNKKIKTKNEKKEINLDSLPEAEKKKVLRKQERRRKQIEKKKVNRQQRANILEQQNENGDIKPSENGSNQLKLKKNGGKFEKKSPANKKNDKKSLINNKLKPTKMTINGREVDIEYYDGFPIKKEDALNLRKLKKEMISKSLPRSEINRTLKLERRKAEKALAREKKKVCFNCRKFGHNLSECQELSNSNSQELIETSGTGICFKCGSTEHTSFACRVVQGQNFKFATCFICKEQGHISKQCPDNARGLYPKGGGCKMCGDVTHFKKDCPQFQIRQEKEQEKFQVETIGGGNIEDLDGGSSIRNISASAVKPNKIVKF